MELDVIAVLVAAQTLLLGIVGWFLRHFIRKDEQWKERVDEKLENLAAIRTICLQEFASKRGMDDAFKNLREHEGRLASLESWRRTVEKD